MQSWQISELFCVFQNFLLTNEKFCTIRIESRPHWYIRSYRFTPGVDLKSVQNEDVQIRGQNFTEGGAVILNPESGNSILLGTGASPPESGNSILDTFEILNFAHF